MNNRLRPTVSGWAVIVLSVVALSLAGCGRKGGLDLPPSASGPSGPAASVAPTDTEAEAAKQPSVFNSTYGTEAPPAAPKGARRSFILDPLLDNR